MLLRFVLFAVVFRQVGSNGGYRNAGDDLSDLTSKIHQLQADVARLTSLNKDVLQRLEKLETQEKNNKDVEQYNSSLVNFYALSGSQYRGGFQQIVFDQVITNTGTFYDPSQGVFTAPYKGMYYLTAYLYGLQNTQATMLKNDEDELAKFNFGASGNYKMGTASAIVELDPGNEVLVWLDTGELPGGNSSGFLGYLMYQTT